MANKKPLELGIGITNNVYAGHTRKLKNGEKVWTSKEDVTSESYKAMLDLLIENGNTLQVSGKNDPNLYTIKLEISKK